MALSPLEQPLLGLVAAGCLPKAQGRSWKCSLWFLWPLAADLGNFHPQDTAAPWDTSRGCRKLLLRLVLPWNVGTALGLSLFWVTPGNPGCSCSPCGAEGWEFPGLFLSSQGSPMGSWCCSQYFSLLLGCVSCLNIPGEEFSHVGTPGHF